MEMERKRTRWILIHQVDANGVTHLSSEDGSWILIVNKEHKTVKVAINTEGSVFGAGTDRTEGPVVFNELRVHRRERE
jgi:hypothetical protein